MLKPSRFISGHRDQLALSSNYVDEHPMPIQEITDDSEGEGYSKIILMYVGKRTFITLGKKPLMELGEKRFSISGESYFISMEDW